MKQKYKSLYGGKRRLTAVEYLSQILVARKIESTGKRVIDNFWKDPVLLKEVKLTEVFVRKLTSLYGEEPVLRAFMRSDMQHVWSTNFPGIEQKIKEEQAKVEAAETIKATEISQNREHAREQYGNTTLLGKLRELDG